MAQAQLSRTRNAAFFAASALALLFAGAVDAPRAHAQGPTPSPIVAKPKPAGYVEPNITYILQKRSDLSIFRRLYEASGLSETIGREAFTVLAPTDKAFAEVPSERIENLLKKENRALLREILSYHILPGRQDTEALMNTRDGLQVQTLNATNGVVVHSLLAPSLAINQANLVTPDIKIEDDILHIVDGVLVPSGRYALELFGDKVRLESANSAVMPAEGSPAPAPAPAPRP